MSDLTRDTTTNVFVHLIKSLPINETCYVDYSFRIDDLCFEYIKNNISNNFKSISSRCKTHDAWNVMLHDCTEYFMSDKTFIMNCWVPLLDYYFKDITSCPLILTLPKSIDLVEFVKKYWWWEVLDLSSVTVEIMYKIELAILHSLMVKNGDFKYLIGIWVQEAMLANLI